MQEAKQECAEALVVVHDLPIGGSSKLLLNQG